MINIWRKTSGPNKLLTFLLALMLALSLITVLFMTVWASPDVATDIILSFESSEPIVNLTVETGAEQPYLPETLRAVVKLADIQPAIPVLPPNTVMSFVYNNGNIPPVIPPSGPEVPWAGPGFVPATPSDTYGYQAAGSNLYIYTNPTGAVSYRRYGSYCGSAPAWFACDENGSGVGIITEIPVTWFCADYDKDIPGIYTFTAVFPGYAYTGPPPYALVTIVGENSGPVPGSTTAANRISGQLWLDENADGIMDENENGVAYYPVHLYAADDLGVTLQSILTAADGRYRFENLEPGSYVVGLTPETIAGIEYRLPLAGVSHDNQFARNEDSNAAYCMPLPITGDSVVDNVHAGMLLTTELTTLASHTVSTFTELESAVNEADPGDTIIITTNIPFTARLSINKNLIFKAAPEVTQVILTSGAQRHIMISENAVITFQNVILDGEKVGGGIVVAPEKSLTLYNAEIRNCYTGPDVTTFVPGGAISIQNRGSLIMYGGKICANQSNQHGGGIYGNNCTILIEEGEISGNTATGSGGGIYATGASHITINSGEISGNTAIDGNGGGIYTGQPADLAVTSDAVIFKSNKASFATLMTDLNDITLHNSKIHTPHFSTLGDNYTFQYAYNNYDISYINGTRLYTVTFNSQGGGSVPASIVAQGSLLTAPVPAPINSGHSFGGWYQEPTCATPWDFTIDTVNQNTTLYAKWPNLLNLTVSKAVAGPFANNLEEFTFSIRFWDADGNLPYGTQLAYTGDAAPGSGAMPPAHGILTLDSSGHTTFTLKHGQQITIAALVNSEVQITELAAAGYTVSFRDSNEASVTADLDTGKRALTGDRVFDFTNTATTIVPAGILTGNIQGPVLLILGLLLIGIGGSIYRIYRSRKESF